MPEADSNDSEQVALAYAAGYAAYPSRDCPYPEDSLLWTAWWEGRVQCDWDSAYWY